MVIIDDDEIDVQPVERRVEPRGVFPGLHARLLTATASGESHEVLEASRVGFFLRMRMPDALPLGGEVDLVLTFEGETIPLRGIVLRKEIDPRRGIAIGITEIDRDAEVAYLRLLGI